MNSGTDKKAAELAGKRLLDNLQNDLRSISNEAKKKMPQLKEAAESGIVRLRSASSKCSDLNKALIDESAEIMEPFFMGCDSKLPKVVQTSLNAIQRLITFKAISPCAADYLLNCLWNLMESNTEELKILQTITLLISTDLTIQGDILSKSIVLCFRLHFTKNQTINNTASATIRQLCTVIYDRVVLEDEVIDELKPVFEISYDELKVGSKIPPRSLKPCAADAFLFFQDLIQLVNAEQPFWLIGLTEMTKTFGLELLETIFNDYTQIFNKHEEFSFLLKERVCPLVIKLFSPNIKYKQFQKQQLQQQLSQQQNTNQVSNSTSNSINSIDKPCFPISIRLLRIVNVIISKYYAMLITESEIFLSLLIKFLESDKPNWQRAVALEVLYKMCTQPTLIKSFCLFYDMKPNSSKILKDLTNALGVYTQSIFIVQTPSNNLLSNIIGVGNSNNTNSNSNNALSQNNVQVQSVNSSQASSNYSFQPSFYFKGQFFPISNQIKTKNVYLDQLDKMDIPTISEGFGLSSSYFCIIELVKSILSQIEPDYNVDQSNNQLELATSDTSANHTSIKTQYTKSKIDSIKNLENLKKLDEDTFNLHFNLLNSTWTGIYAVLSLLIEASTDEEITGKILDLIEQLIAVYGIYDLKFAREAMIKTLCKASLPTNYNLPQLNFTIPVSINSTNSSNNTKITVINSNSPVPGSSINLTENSSKFSSNFGENSKSNYLTQLSYNATTLQQQNSQVSSSTNFFSNVNNVNTSLSSNLSNNTSSNTSNNSNSLTNNENFDLKQQVVAVGTALPHSSQFNNNNNSESIQQAPTSVLLTAKNLQCMKILLKVAHQHGVILKENWYITLLTLQHLVWILGLKPSTGGSLKSTKNKDPNNSNNLITTAAMSDLPVLTAMLSRLFETSNYSCLANLLSRVFQCSMELDDKSLIFLVDSLCKLSKESMEIAYNNREPSLFAVAKLLETGLVNLHRYEIFWDQMTNHLLSVCQHPQIKMREWGTETLTTLIKTALQTSESSKPNTNDDKKKNNVVFLKPLQSLSDIVFTDIRQKQLDCCLQILQTSGDFLVSGWPQILEIIGLIDKIPNENLIRLAFQCLQHIISDFLNQIPSNSLVSLVNTTEKFASQCQELNVSLTAIGLLWNIVDFFHQSSNKIQNELKDLKIDSSSSKLLPFECLWMCLFSRLGDLCTDERPAVRKSASQTLFHTLGTHANILKPEIWSSILWEVLFPLLERVHTISINASTDKIMDVSKSMGITGFGISNNSAPLMLHHSRNTAQKQWSETQVLILAGVAHVFAEKRSIFLECLDDFYSAWKLLLKHIEIPALSKNCEVSLNALNCFQEILHCNKQMVLTNSKNSKNKQLNDYENENSKSKDQLVLDYNSIPDQKTIELWKMAWEVWCSIGTQCFNGNLKLEKDDTKDESQIDSNNEEYFAPSQAFLTLLIQIFSKLYDNIKINFDTKCFYKLSLVLENSIAVPIDLTTQAYLMSATVTSNNYDYHSNNQQISLQPNQLVSNSYLINHTSIPLTNLQEAILYILELFQNNIFAQLSSLNKNSTSHSNVSNSEQVNLTYAEELLTCVFSQLLSFSTYACKPPLPVANNAKNNFYNEGISNNLGKSLFISNNSILNKYQNPVLQPVDWTTINFVPFGERSLKIATQLYTHCATWKCVINSGVLHTFIKTLRIPLTLKYNCPSQSTWQIAIQCLITLLQIGLPVARQNAKEFSSIWADLALCLEGCLFPTSSQLNVSVEEMQQDEMLDVKLVQIIRDNILPFASEMPKVFVLQIVSILNRGSIHSATSISPVDTDSSRKIREEFAKTCFETLLQFSFFGPKNNPNLFIQCSYSGSNSNNNAEIGLVNKLAVTSLLQRFNDVVKKYVEDESLSGKCPLPRHRMAEISFVLKALATLICSLKKAPKETVKNGVWDQLILLYPHLVDCTMSNSVQVNQSLREVLYEYKDLLSPYKYKKQTNGNLK